MDEVSTPGAAGADHAGRRGADPPASRSGVERVTAELGALSSALDRLDQFAAERLGLNRTDQRALDLVGRSGSIAPTRLARALGMSTGATSTVIDRLESAGYVRRETDPVRRRGTAVRMTEDATARCSTIFDPLITATAAQAARSSDEELAIIADFLAAHRELLHDHLDRAQSVEPSR